MITEYPYRHIPLETALEYIRNWNPETQTVTELKNSYWNACKKSQDNFNWKHTEENKAIFDEVVNFRKYHPPVYKNVDFLNNMLYRDGVIFNINRVIATDFENNCLLFLHIDDNGKSQNIFYGLYSLEEVFMRMITKWRGKTTSIQEFEELLGFDETDKIDCPHDCENCPFGLDAQDCEDFYWNWLLDQLETQEL